MRLIGVTGQMGSGKTTVVKWLGQLGAEVIDADEITHKLMQKAFVKKSIVNNFGENILKKGKIDRRILSKQVFSSKRKLKMLCSIVHPLIIKEIMHRIKKSRYNYVVIDAPLLIESGLHKMMDKVLVVFADMKTLIKRCVKKGFDANDAKMRIRSQMPLKNRIKFADYVIDNNGSIGKTKKNVIKIWRELKYR